MCLSTTALALFLNMIAAPITTEPDRIVVHAEVADTHWVMQSDQWCTIAPQLQGQARLAELNAEKPI